ncbi:uncharacterized protein JN550_005631 [Neoarthrinium moseri]|uniref:uncharacterized protein n=1 Tax=Neoarthrinium moseri TaxID=1658444 RepID=UPI001FDE19A6|nr:uncharacterized protein JN550_005631 [Neoarthrinium moseri]KAI1869650.1 hypothetical protein JN550_005631 [Neoarthrinium moseri]
MLGRAKQNYAARPAPPPVKPDLKKDPFPSSSPSYRDVSIADFTKKNRPTNPSTARFGSSKADLHPLKPRSDNAAPRPSSTNTSSVTSYVKPTQGFSSLYSQSDSFKEEPVSVSSSAANSTTAKTAAPVYIAEDDFSDDEALELDYECPASLPVAPAEPKAGKTPCISLLDSPPARNFDPSPMSSSRPIPWTSSPLEHHYPPRPMAQPPPKRASTDDVKPAVVTAAKKRKMPDGWSKSVKDEDAFQREPTARRTRPPKDEPEVVDLFATHSFSSTSTPAPKSKNVPWDTTYSAMKEKKKQLKNQSKKTEVPTEYSMEDIRAATGGHAKATHTAMSLSAEQEHVKRLVVEEGQSVFFTGPAGTGKSVLMRAIIEALKKKWARDPERVSITASTGLAACNIGGMTLHSFAGIGLGKEEVPDLVRKIRRNPKAKNRWLRTKVLIVDEVSMVDGDLFDKLANIARTIRNNGRPWGGIQLVITGDFFQLPPVPDRNKRDTKFAFDAATWTTSIDHTIGLTQVFRQRDHDFANILNEMRMGRVSEQTVQTFRALSRPLHFDDGLTATELFPTRQEVERSNEMRLRNLPGNGVHFAASDSGDPAIRDRLLENMMAPKSIELKKGAQVMCIKNMDETLVNGSLGIVKSFMCEAAFDRYREKEGDEGDDLGDAALAKSKIRSFTKDLNLTKDLTEWPVVQFTCSDGSHRIMLIQQEEWKVELPNGEVQAKRAALPLILAWALSIHKAQGQTLERVKVDLGKVFEKGQAYVALSRATTKEGLQVLRFDKSKVMAHPRVIQFYNQLYSAEAAVKKKPAPNTVADFAKKGRLQSFVRKAVDVIDLDDDEEAMAAYG